MSGKQYNIYDYVLLELWDYVTDEEYSNASRKIKNTKPYEERFNELSSIITETNNIRLIETSTAYSIQEALKLTSDFMQMGYEGSIVKDKSSIFRDGTNPQQLKLKLEIELDLRIIEFVEGNKGSKNEEYFSAIVIGNDEGTIRTQIGVTTMTEDTRNWFHANRENVIGRVMAVLCNDITIGGGKEQYALSHGRYIEMRNDKDETDTLERAFQIKEMAMQLGSIK